MPHHEHEIEVFDASGAHLGAAVLADRDDVTRESTTQLWPHRDGTDAMFCALLRRRA